MSVIFKSRIRIADCCIVVYWAATFALSISMHDDFCGQMRFYLSVPNVVVPAHDPSLNSVHTTAYYVH